MFSQDLWFRSCFLFTLRNYLVPAWRDRQTHVITMRSRSRQPSTLSIRPPSPNPQQQASMPSSIHRNLQINTSNQGMISPRKAPLPPSPTQSSVSGASSNYNYDDIRRPRGGSDVGKSGGGGGYELAPPPVPSKASSDKKLPPPPAFFNNSAGPSSPHRRDGQGTSGKGWAVGVYDNKLVRIAFYQCSLRSDEGKQY